MYPKHLLSAFLIAVLLMVPSATVFAQEESIADIAADNDDLSTLVAALTVADLVEALEGDGPFTVFAPTNDAFAALPAGMSDELLAGEAEELTDVLLYHVLPGVVLAEDISDGLQAETQQGEFVVFSVDGDSISINDADIIAADILANNGVIHVINRVLLVPEEVVLNDEPVEEEVAEEAIDAEADDEDAETAEADDAEADEATDDAEADEEEAEADEATDDAEADEEEAAEIAEDADAPSVTADDQTSDGTIVTVSSVTAAQSGWMVIHLDADGRPGPVIGQTGVPAGTTDNVIVFLDEDISGETALWAMLHVDEGQTGVYEFPGPDVPVTVQDTIVMASFTASAPEVVVEEEAVDEEAVEEEAVDEEEVVEEEAVEEEAIDEEAVDEEAVEEEAVEIEADDEEMAEEMVEEEEAPETLPATGSGMTGAPLAVTAAALVVLVLAAGTILSRRRLNQI